MAGSACIRRDYTVQAVVELSFAVVRRTRVRFRESPIQKPEWTPTVVFTLDCVSGIRHWYSVLPIMTGKRRQ